MVRADRLAPEWAADAPVPLDFTFKFRVSFKASFADLNVAVDLTSNSNITRLMLIT